MEFSLKICMNSLWECLLVKEVVHSVGFKGNVSGNLMRIAFSVEGKPSDY